MNWWSAPAGTNAALPSPTSTDSPSIVNCAAPLEDDVDLVVGVRLLPVGLGRDEHVHADLEPRRLVDDLVPAARFLEPPSWSLRPLGHPPGEPSGQNTSPPSLSPGPGVGSNETKSVRFGRDHE